MKNVLILLALLTSPLAFADKVADVQAELIRNGDYVGTYDAGYGANPIGIRFYDNAGTLGYVFNRQPVAKPFESDDKSCRVDERGQAAFLPRQIVDLRDTTTGLMGGLLLRKCDAEKISPPKTEKPAMSQVSELTLVGDQLRFKAIDYVDPSNGQELIGSYVLRPLRP